MIDSGCCNICNTSLQDLNGEKGGLKIINYKGYHSNCVKSIESIELETKTGDWAIIS